MSRDLVYGAVWKGIWLATEAVAAAGVFLTGVGGLGYVAGRLWGDVAGLIVATSLVAVAAGVVIVWLIFAFVRESLT
jgi:uncharacterized membrane-anchored protein